MKERTEFVFAGTGGQGLVMMGILMGQAATARGLNVSQTQSYGIANRGGVSYSEVVLSKNEIVYPKTMDPNVIITLTNETYRMFRKKYPQNMIVVDSDEVTESSGDNRAIAMPLTSMCRELGSMRFLNMLAIGVAGAFTDIISKAELAETVRKRFPKVADQNEKAFNKGFDEASRLIKVM